VLPLLLALAVADPSSVFEEILARGDRHYARRAEGASGPRADPTQIGLAIDEYRGALALDPDSTAARYRMLRALYFRATFCGASEEEQRRFVDEMRRVADAGLARLEARAEARQPGARIEALRRVEDSTALFFWAAVTWGEWAQRHSVLSAARQGAATRIRDLAQTVVDLDPGFEEGGGYRILGRLHDLSPRLPLVTGWVSRKAALENLRRAYDISKANTVNQLFLAEAILRHAPERREEALSILRHLASARPSPEYPVEDAYFSARAREALEGRR
jgi:hypothetical protein